VALPSMAADSATIVTLGSFSPTKFTPKWLLSKGLIGTPEYEESQIELYLPNEALAFVSGWLKFQARPDAIQLITEDQAEFERLRDLAVGILRDDPTIRVSALGINRQVHFQPENAADWDSIGAALSSREAWADVLKSPGMRTVIVWGGRPDDYSGRIQVQVEPSVVFPIAVFVAYNDHYDLGSIGQTAETPQELTESGAPVQDDGAISEGSSSAIKILNGEWSDSMRRAEAVVERVAQLARKQT
jgi:hypothetical protein